MMRRQLSTLALGILVLACLLIGGAGSATAAPALQGDADCSNVVNVDDAAAVLRHAAALGEAECQAAADVNCDSSVDSRDALGLIRHIAGLPANEAACTPIGSPLAGVTIVLDPSLAPEQGTLPGLGDGPPRDVSASVGPDGVQVDYVADEIVYKPDSEAALQEFLDKYNGTVLRDGTSGEASPASSPISGDYYLVRVDPSMSPLDDLRDNLEEAGLSGQVRFSSEEAQRLAAIVAREREDGVSPNIVGGLDVSNEVPLDAMHTMWMDAETLFYMDETSSLSVGVAHAWDYLKYHLLPPDNGTFTPVQVGIVDSGFALSTSTGAPLDGNLDYWYFGAAPRQYDEAGDDNKAGGESLVSCSGGASCPWHGQGSFGVCCARPHNNYGTAGSGGDVVMPILVRVDSSFYTMGDGIKKAFRLGANVITMSMSGDCGFWCDVSTADGNMQDAVNEATSQGSIVLASAGNSGVDISDNEIIPCKLDHVICVGGVNTDKSNQYNYGSGVDIWAPYYILSTSTPLSIAFDDDDFGTNELYQFGGTSAATPFVAGIVALMKAADPTLDWDDVLFVLQDTANSSPFAEVAHGYVDAYRAVLAVLPNQPPTVQLVQPVADSVHSYNNLRLSAIVTDPEPGAGLPRFEGDTTVGFYGDQGLLCSTSQVTYHDVQPYYECTAPFVEPGTKSVEARVTDPFGGTDTDGAPVTITNTAPQISRYKPVDGATFYATQLIKFETYVIDPDESPFPGNQILWQSNLDGVLSNGTTFRAFLTEGTHTMTVTATDERGLSDSESFTLNILSGAGVPAPFITSPADDSFWGAGQQITFDGFANDDEDGNLEGNSLAWYSDIDGFLGYGAPLQASLSGATNCQQGVQFHTITFTATDSDAHSVSDQIQVQVGIIC